ncbi:MAG: CDP-glycerol glycerophosphotransferase (TagB/SpsB family) [Parasphingorhabdus sp.]
MQQLANAALDMTRVSERLQHPPLVLVLPNSMSIRNVFASNLWKELSALPGKIYIVSHSRDLIPTEKLCGGMEWRSISDPAEIGPGWQSMTVFLRKVLRFFSLRIQRILRADYPNIAFRFNHIHNFYAHQFKQAFTGEKVEREALAGNYISAELGLPRPDSSWLYWLLYRTYNTSLQIIDPSINEFFKHIQPSRVVVWHAQNLLSRDYVLAAKKYGAQTCAVVGSWDRPTTKGPISHWFKQVIVYSSQMKNDVVDYHAIPADKVVNVGWPLFDGYANSRRTRSAEIIDWLNLPTNCCLLVFTANSARLGENEPHIAGYLADQVVNNRYDKPCMLLIRPHPVDNEWKSRYGLYQSQGRVIVQAAELAGLKRLEDTLCAADVVISGQGSISLDAAAVDAPIINLGFDGKNPDDSELARQWYKMDHYCPVVKSGAVEMVNGFEELDRAINRYLMNPDYRAEGRRWIRENMMDPLDGCAASRLTDLLRNEVLCEESV